MYAIILAGGSGTRLWPLSRELYPKQYLNLPTKPDQAFSPGADFNTPSPDNDKGLKTPSPPGGEVRGEGAVLSDLRPPTSNLQSGEGRGKGEKINSLFLNTVTRVMHTIPADKIIVVTHVDQAGEIKRQLDRSGIKGVRILAEPEARNTAPAIGLAAWYLHHEAGLDAVMAVLPSDHLIPDQDQFAALLEEGEKAATAYGLVTFGIRPTFPETGFGYICCGEELAPKTYRVEKFVEKPDLEKAEQYLADPRYLWNSGMFVYRVGTLIDQYRTHLPEMYASLGRIDYHKLGNLAEVYSTLEKISVDYGILERAANVTVIPTDIDWSDLGSWEAYHQVTEHDTDGNFIKGRAIAIDTKDSLIYSTSRLVGTAGVNDLVIVDTADALLVCDRHSSQDVKKIVDQLKSANAVEAREHKTIYRPWGSYTSLEMGPTYQVKRINVNPGARLSLQSHNHRAENWVVVEGEALVTIDDNQIVVKRGESVFIPKGARHRMENQRKEPLAIIEVQNGDYLGEDDIVRYEDDYGRTPEAAPPADQLKGEGWVGSKPTHGSISLQSRPSTLPEDLSTRPKSVQTYRQPGQEAKASASTSTPGPKTPSPLGGEGRGEGAALSDLRPPTSDLQSGEGRGEGASRPRRRRKSLRQRTGLRHRRHARHYRPRP